METFYVILQLLVSVGLVSLILLQAKGQGLGKSLGGTGSYHSKKGVEKIVHIATIVFAVLFLAVSLLNAFML